MKHLLSTLILGLACSALAAESDCVKQMREQSEATVKESLVIADYGRISGKQDEAKAVLNLSLDPYMSISWTGIDGAADIGAGFNALAGITPNLSIVGFAEADDTENTLVERFGAGLRYTAWLGQRVSLDGGFAGGHDLSRDLTFLRLPLGLNLYAVKTDNVDLGLRVSYAFDISGGRKNGISTGRGFVGPTFNLRF